MRRRRLQTRTSRHVAASMESFMDVIQAHSVPPSGESAQDKVRTQYKAQGQGLPGVSRGSQGSPGPCKALGGLTRPLRVL